MALENSLFKNLRPLNPDRPLNTSSLNTKGQENPNFSAFGTCGSLSNDPVFDPGSLGKRSDGTKITKLYAKPDVERVKKTRFMEDARKIK